MPLTARRPSQELIDVVGALGGSWHGHIATCRCPAHADKTPSLSLRQGDRGILVTCFAGCRAEDVLRALRHVPVSQHFTPPVDAPGRGTPNILRLWNEAAPVQDTLAVRYLTRRHLDHRLADLRFHPRCPLGPKPRTVFLPALLVGVRERREIVALQRIFLDPRTANYTGKVMLGRPMAGAWRGGQVGRVLALAEGFETAAAYAALHAIPCWASLGSRRYDQVAVPDQVDTLFLAHDADAEGRRAAARAEAHYQRPGRTIIPAPPPRPDKDWADTLRAQQERGGGSSM